MRGVLLSLWVSLPLVVVGCSPTDTGTTDASGSSGSTGGDTNEATGTDTQATDGTDTSASTTAGTTETGTTGEPAPEPECPTALDPGMELEAGEHSFEIDVGGYTRDYNVEIPDSYEPGVALPLIINMHGFGSNAWQQALFSQMDWLAGYRDFIIVYPNGVDNSWNGGPACCGTASSEEIDDSAFLRALLDDLGTRLCFDPRRVYATGMSNGGYMSHRVACDGADFIAAVSPVAGALGVAPASCSPSRPMPVYIVHGALDQSVPVELAVDSFEFWAETNACEGEPERTVVGVSGYCDEFASSRCADGAGVKLCVLGDLGHCWPGGSEGLCDALEDSYEDTIDANATMMDFFDQYWLPE